MGSNAVNDHPVGVNAILQITVRIDLSIAGFLVEVADQLLPADGVQRRSGHPGSRPEAAVDQFNPKRIFWMLFVGAIGPRRGGADGQNALHLRCNRVVVLIDPRRGIIAVRPIIHVHFIPFIRGGIAVAVGTRAAAHPLTPLPRLLIRVAEDHGCLGLGLATAALLPPRRCRLPRGSPPATAPQRTIPSARLLILGVAVEIIFFDIRGGRLLRDGAAGGAVAPQFPLASGEALLCIAVFSFIIGAVKLLFQSVFVVALCGTCDARAAASVGFARALRRADGARCATEARGDGLFLVLTAASVLLGGLFLRAAATGDLDGLFVITAPSALLGFLF